MGFAALMLTPRPAKPNTATGPTGGGARTRPKARNSASEDQHRDRASRPRRRCAGPQARNSAAILPGSVASPHRRSPRQRRGVTALSGEIAAEFLDCGRPSVRLARHERRRQALRRQNGISGVGKHCDDNDTQPGASAAATSPANKTMHNPAAFHTAVVTATCATPARLRTRTA